MRAGDGEVEKCMELRRREKEEAGSKQKCVSALSRYVDGDAIYEVRLFEDGGGRVGFHGKAWSRWLGTSGRTSVMVSYQVLQKTFLDCLWTCELGDVCQMSNGQLEP